MNKKYTECDIVRELLPLYIEQKTGEESNALIAKHLPECEECGKVYQWMSADLLAQVTDEGREGSIEGNKHSKKKRKRLTYAGKCWLALGAALLAYAVLLGGIVVYTFWYLTWGIL